MRFESGKDFLSRTVSTALTALDADLTVLPPYSPHLKGTVENLNLNASRMLFAALPGYTPKQKQKKPDRRPIGPPMPFQAFTEELLAWAHWWNTEHRSAELHGATPLQAWQADPTPLGDIPAQDVWTFTLEDDGRIRSITSHGVRFKNRYYLADWMTGQAGRTVTVRFMPHHDHEIEVCDTHGHHLGTAHLADAATPEQLSALRQTRSRRARRLRAEAKAAEKLRRVRFAPATAGQKARRLDALTSSQADHELARDAAGDLSELALPDLIPPAAPPAHWHTPPALAAPQPASTSSDAPVPEPPAPPSHPDGKKP